MLITLRINLQALHKVLEILLLLRAVLQAALLQLRVVFQEQLLLGRDYVVDERWAADDGDSASVGKGGMLVWGKKRQKK